MTAAEVPASIIRTSVNTKEHKVFQTLSNNSVLELEHSLLKNINLKQQMSARFTSKNFELQTGVSNQKATGNCVINIGLL